MALVLHMIPDVRLVLPVLVAQLHPILHVPVHRRLRRHFRIRISPLPFPHHRLDVESRPLRVSDHLGDQSHQWHPVVSVGPEAAVRVADLLVVQLEAHMRILQLLDPAPDHVVDQPGAHQEAGVLQLMLPDLERLHRQLVVFV